MERKHYESKEIADKLRPAEALHGQSTSIADGIRRLGTSEVTFYFHGRLFRCK